MMKIIHAALAMIGFRMLIVATRGEMLIDPGPPIRSTPQRQIVVAHWHSTADGRLEARWVPDSLAV
jgi:hypothetical protein